MLMSSGRSRDGRKDELLWRYLAPNWLRTCQMSRLHEGCEIPFLEQHRACVCMNSQNQVKTTPTYTHNQLLSIVSVGGLTIVPSMQWGLYDSRVMRASKNFPLSSILSSITADRDKKDFKRMQRIFIWHVIYNIYIIRFKIKSAVQWKS